MLTDHRPSVDQLLNDTSVKYRPTIGEVSVNEKLYRPRHIWNDYRPYLDRLSTTISTDCRPSVDRVSTDCRPSVNRLSTECRPTIDQVSTTISTAISTDISVDITQSKQDPNTLTKVIGKTLETNECLNTYSRILISLTLNFSSR